MNFYFTYCRGNTDWRWTDIHTLCLKSCKKNAGAKAITVFYDREGEGSEWLEARALAGVEWIQQNFKLEINGHAVKDQRLVHDVFRLQTLWERGGWYCDLDFVFLKNFETLRDSPATLAIQCKFKSKLNCALMGCEPGSLFIKAYLDEYRKWTPKHEKEFWTYANVVPWNLSKTYPVTVLAKRSFYPVAWSCKKFWAGGYVCLNFSHAVHLWESLHPTLCIADLMKTDLKPYVENVINDLPKGLVHIQEGIIVNFD